jgi:transcriptional regulator with GAF, ATPase, and Fis domain
VRPTRFFCRSPLAGTITETLFRTRTGLFLHPVSEGKVFGCFPQASTFITTTFRAGMRSIMAVPLISRDETIGVLHFRSKKTNAYTEQDFGLAEKIGVQIAGAIAITSLTISSVNCCFCSSDLPG